jgi:hypothetical protein
VAQCMALVQRFERWPSQQRLTPQSLRGGADGQSPDLQVHAYAFGYLEYIPRAGNSGR